MLKFYESHLYVLHLIELGEGLLTFLHSVFKDDKEQNSETNGNAMES